jgi:hypothetical protein
VYLVIGFSFQSIAFLVFVRLCYMCVLCQVYVEGTKFCLLLRLDMFLIGV